MQVKQTEIFSKSHRSVYYWPQNIVNISNTGSETFYYLMQTHLEFDGSNV